MPGKQVRESITYSDFADVKSRIESWKDRYGLTDEDFEFEVEEEYGSTSVVVVFERPETEAEKSRREKDEAEHQERTKKWRLEQYAALKKEFGDV